MKIFIILLILAASLGAAQDENPYDVKVFWKSLNYPENTEYLVRANVTITYPQVTQRGKSSYSVNDTYFFIVPLDSGRTEKDIIRYITKTIDLLKK